MPGRRRSGPTAATAIRAARSALRRMIRTFTARLAPSVAEWKWASRNGVTALPVTPVAVQQGQALGEGPVVQRRVELLVDRQRVGDDQRRRACTPCSSRAASTSATCSGESSRPVQVEAAVGEVEAGEPAGAVADHRDAEGLQPLQRRAHVEDRLDPGADHRDRGPGQRDQVGRLVEGVRRLPVHPAQAAGGEHADPGRRGHRAGRGDRGGAVRAGRPPPRPGRGRRAWPRRRRWPAGSAGRRRGRPPARRRSCRSWPAPPRRPGPSARSPAPPAGCPGGAGRARRSCSPGRRRAGRRGGPRRTSVAVADAKVSHTAARYGRRAAGVGLQVDPDRDRPAKLVRLEVQT